MSGFQEPSREEVEKLLASRTPAEIEAMGAEIQAAVNRLWIDAMSRWVEAGWVRDPEAAVAQVDVTVDR